MKLYSDKELADIFDTQEFHLIGETADKNGTECYVTGEYVRNIFMERPLGKPDIIQVTDGNELDDKLNMCDFTVNALAVCLNAGRYGELTDPFDGLYDIEDGMLRTPYDPESTFADEPLLMLRCIRLAAELNYFIEPETFSAIENNRESINTVEGCEISEELNRILMTDVPSKGLMELHRSGLLQLIMPELSNLDIVEKGPNGRAHKNNFYHTLEVLDNVAKARHSNDEHDKVLWLRWSALLHDIGKPKSKRWEPAIGWTFHNHNFIGAKMVNELFRRLQMPQDDRMEYVHKLVDLHMRPIVIADEVVTDSAVRRLITDAGDDIDDLMTLCEADITSKNEVRKRQFLDNFRLVRKKLVDLTKRDHDRLLQPVIDGEEIMAMFNLQPSPEVGTLKQTLKSAVLNNDVPNEREPLMSLLLHKAKEMGLAPCQLTTITE